MPHLRRSHLARIMLGLKPAMAALLLAAPAQAAPPPLAPQGCNWVVNNATDNSFQSLRDVVTCIPAGETVTFAPGMANQTIVLTSGAISVTRPMTIDASAAPGVRVDAGNNSRIFNITASSTVTLTGLVLERGHTVSGNGGAVLATHAVVLNQVQVLSSTAPAGQGGGLFVASSALLSGTQFISNTAGFNAGGAYVQSDAVVIGGRFERNVCQSGGCQGGGLNTGTLTLSGTQFIGNLGQGNGGGVYADSAAILTNGVFQDNHCSDTGCLGGGLDTNSTLALTGTQVISNTSQGYGGGAYANLAAVLTNGLFQGNECDDTDCQGGGLFTNDTLTISGTQFINNGSRGNGAGAYATLAAVLTNGGFQDNHCSTGCQGGGLFTNASLTLTGTQLISNSSSDGGGAYAAGTAVLTNGLFQGNQCSLSHCRAGGLDAGGLTLTGTRFISNTSLGDGGGASIGLGGAVLTNGLFQGNRCMSGSCRGGGLQTSASLALSGTQFISNTSRTDGGGAYIQTEAALTNGRFVGNGCTDSGCQGGGLYANTTLVLTGTQFIGNGSGDNGGGIYILDAGTVTNARFEGNTCRDSGCRGAGLYANTTGSVRGSSFSANHAGGRGGALAGTALTLANVTLSDNIADVSGGGLFAFSGSSLNLYNVTVANNQAPSGAGLLAEAGATVDIRNTIFANNSINNCSGPIASGTHNLEWPNTDCADAGGSGVGFTTADPQLLPLALNAPGSTLTRALGPASAARDAGAAAFCAAAPVNNVDQRGVLRPLDSDLIAGAICDIGAYEAAAPLWQLFLSLVRR